MMTKENYVTVTLGYTGTNLTRKYKLEDVADGDLAGVKTGVMAINASLTAGTDDGLADFFRSDDYDDSNSNYTIGKFNRIVAAQIDEVTTTEIDLS